MLDRAQFWTGFVGAKCVGGEGAVKMLYLLQTFLPDCTKCMTELLPAGLVVFFLFVKVCSLRMLNLFVVISCSFCTIFYIQISSAAASVYSGARRRSPRQCHLEVGFIFHYKIVLSFAVKARRFLPILIVGRVFS